MTHPFELSATEARKLIGNKKLSPIELAKSCIEQIDKVNPSINAVVAIDHDAVMKSAEKSEDDVMSGNELRMLHGIPVGIKDLNLVNIIEKIEIAPPGYINFFLPKSNKFNELNRIINDDLLVLQESNKKNILR